MAHTFFLGLYDSARKEHFHRGLFTSSSCSERNLGMEFQPAVRRTDRRRVTGCRPSPYRAPASLGRRAVALPYPPVLLLLAGGARDVVEPHFGGSFGEVEKMSQRDKRRLVRAEGPGSWLLAENGRFALKLFVKICEDRWTK